MYLLIHTMTITECDYVLQAQFFHAFGQIQNAKLIARRVSLKLHRGTAGNRHKINLQRLSAPSLKTLMKRNSGNIRHHLRTIRIGSQHSFTNQPASDDKTLVALPSPPHQSLPTVEKVQPQEQNVVTTDQLSALSSTQQASNWLTCNRFDKYLQTFSSFSGADMLRMSRDDLIQICGHADGIRLYNALHSKSIAPKLTIYVCRENSTVFNAIFLTALNNGELLQKLSALLKTPCDQVRDIYLLGPQSIHVQLSNDVMRHIKDDTMFHVEVLQENGNYVFLLKPSSRC